MAVINDWAVGIVYPVDATVIVMVESAPYNSVMYRCLAEHTSLSFATDWGNGLWEVIRTQGSQGVAGENGPQGPTGPAGADGVNGAAGADGVIVALASQAEAEAGTDNLKGMTPLRTKQAIDVNLVTPLANIATNTADLVTNTAAISANAGAINALDARLNIVENVSPKSRAIGEQRLVNSSGPTDIIGLDATPDGQGVRFEMNNSGAKSARVHVEIYRKDDAETRVTTCMLIMHFVPSTNLWYIERESTTVLAGNPDGITFGINTTNPVAGVYVGLVTYTADNMVGGNYDIDSKVKYMIEELSDTFA